MESGDCLCAILCYFVLFCAGVFANANDGLSIAHISHHFTRPTRTWIRWIRSQPQSAATPARKKAKQGETW